MKNILFLLAAAICLVSCGMPRMGNTPGSHPKAYIQTAAGKVAVKSIRVKARKLIVDGKEYNKKEVTAYCDGNNEYIKVAKGTFAGKKYQGDINVFSSTTTSTSMSYVGSSAGNPSGWSSSSRSRTIYYLQKGDSPALLLLNYKNVKSLLTPNEPAWKYITTYEKKKKVNRIISYSSLGLVGLGIGMMAGSTNETVVGAGAISFSAGCTSLLCVCLPRKASNSIRLFRAVGKHNGVEK